MIRISSSNEKPKLELRSNKQCQQVQQINISSSNKKHKLELFELEDRPDAMNHKSLLYKLFFREKVSP